MKNIIFILILFSFFGCKKDKLKDDKSIFVGKWRWVYSVKTERDNCDNPPVTTIINPSTEGKNYSIEFKEKGCVTFYENGEKIDKYRIVFSASGWRDDNNSNYMGYTYFSFDLNNKRENQFSGYVKVDTLIDIGYRFPYIISGCTTYINYFIKE